MLLANENMFVVVMENGGNVFFGDESIFMFIGSDEKSKRCHTGEGLNAIKCTKNAIKLVGAWQ